MINFSSWTGCWSPAVCRVAKRQKWKFKCLRFLKLQEDISCISYNKRQISEVILTNLLLILKQKKLVPCILSKNHAHMFTCIQKHHFKHRFKLWNCCILITNINWQFSTFLHFNTKFWGRGCFWTTHMKTGRRKKSP